jgi:hypothetical protein
MALATMNGAEIVTAHMPYTLHLSSSSLPRHAKQNQSEVHTLMVPCVSFSSTPAGRQRRFKQYRRFGPLVSVQNDVDVGLSWRGDLILFWDSESLLAAMDSAGPLGGEEEVRLLHMSAVVISVCACNFLISGSLTCL